MGQDPCEYAPEVFPVAPDCIALFPASGQQRVVAALQQDVAAGRHLLCISGPAGSGKTVLLRDLRQGFRQGLVGMIEQPVSGRLLFDVAESLQIGAEDDNESTLGRRLAMLLSTASQQRQPIIQIVDAADTLSTDDLNLLLHFFPPAYATLILAGRATPETWLSGCSTSAGDVRIDRSYNVEPLSADETAGYIRHRLRMAALPENLFEPAILTLIHQMNDGVPGDINKFCAGALARAGRRGRASVLPHRTEPVQAVAQECRLPEAASEAIATAEAIVPPVFEQPHETGTPAHLVIVNPQEVRDDPQHLPWRMRRLQRSVWIWRALAIMVSVALMLEYTQDTWLDQMPAEFATLWRGAESSSDNVELKRLSQESVQSGVLVSATDGTALLSTTELRSNSTSPYAQYFLREDAEMPLFHYKMDSSDSAPIQWTLSVATIPEYVRKLGPIDATGQEAKTDSGGTDRVGTRLKSTRGSARMTLAQRQEMARMYAERAEREFRNGQEGAASLSIQRGLASDPRNSKLLKMRVEVLEALRRP